MVATRGVSILRLHDLAHSTSFSPRQDASPASSVEDTGENADKTKLGLSQLNEVQQMAKDQLRDMMNLHEKMVTLGDSCRRISVFAEKLMDVEKNMDEAHAIADRTAGQDTGIGKISEKVAEIKAMAVDSQHKMNLAKASIDKLIPRKLAVTPEALDLLALAQATCMRSPFLPGSVPSVRRPETLREEERHSEERRRHVLQQRFWPHFL
mmetsp:Transcript_52275/g.124693  ORF Transcript_52275/g.124693 Transcript_52275/m.124693 type:complete len:209 (+) Transcript_52275:64-690(+)